MLVGKEIFNHVFDIYVIFITNLHFKLINDYSFLICHRKPQLSFTVSICQRLTILYNGGEKLQLNRKSIIGTYEYAGISKSKDADSFHPVYTMFTYLGNTKYVSIIHKYDKDGWIGSQVVSFLAIEKI